MAELTTYYLDIRVKALECATRCYCKAGRAGESIYVHEILETAAVFENYLKGQIREEDMGKIELML